jgi:hypothetical protein
MVMVLGASALATDWDITRDAEKLERLGRVGGAQTMVKLSCDVEVCLEGSRTTRGQCKLFSTDGTFQRVLASVLGQIFNAFLAEGVMAFYKFGILELDETECTLGVVLWSRCGHVDDNCQ